VGADYSELIASQWLVPVRVFRPAGEIEGVAMPPVAAWLKLAGERRGFAFFSRVIQAMTFSGELAGTAAVWGAMDADERRAALESFRSGRIRCLANVQLLTEGVDIPEASACLLATGCDHASGYLQRVGRIMRPAPGKTDALLIDLVGASHRHGLPDEDREYALDGVAIRTRAKLESLSVCQQCGCTHRSSDAACPQCGWVAPPKPVRQRIWNVPMEEAQPADAKQAAILRYRQQMAAAPPEKLQALWRKLSGTAQERGYKPGWAAFQFKLRTGRWPDRAVRS
jgi:hypothetical protein